MAEGESEGRSGEPSIRARLGGGLRRIFPPDPGGIRLHDAASATFSGLFTFAAILLIGWVHRDAGGHRGLRLRCERLRGGVGARRHGAGAAPDDDPDLPADGGASHRHLDLRRPPDRPRRPARPAHRRSALSSGARAALRGARCRGSDFGALRRRDPPADRRDRGAARRSRPRRCGGLSRPLLLLASGACRCMPGGSRAASPVRSSPCWCRSARPCGAALGRGSSRPRRAAPSTISSLP